MQHSVRESNVFLNWIYKKRNITTKSVRRSGVISVFRGQKFCTRKILRVLPSFLHFLEAKDIKNCLKWHQKQFPQGNSRKWILKFEEIMQTAVKFHHHCHFNSTLKGFTKTSEFVSTFGVVRNDFFWEDIFSSRTEVRVWMSSIARRKERLHALRILTRNPRLL